MRGINWKDSQLQQVNGHWCRIHFSDGTEIVALVYIGHLMGQPNFMCPDQEIDVNWIDSPSQVVAIGPKAKAPRF